MQKQICDVRDGEWKVLNYPQPLIIGCVCVCGGGGARFSTCDVIFIGHFTNVKKISYFQYVIYDTPRYAVGSGHGTAAVLLQQNSF